jgi:hypothetical protein
LRAFSSLAPASLSASYSSVIMVVIEVTPQLATRSRSSAAPRRRLI